MDKYTLQRILLRSDFLDIINTCRTNKLARHICDDDNFLRKKTKLDLNLSDSDYDKISSLVSTSFSRLKFFRYLSEIKNNPNIYNIPMIFDRMFKDNSITSSLLIFSFDYMIKPLLEEYNKIKNTRTVRKYELSSQLNYLETDIAAEADYLNQNKLYDHIMKLMY
jgi:hypothetical protein